MKYFIPLFLIAFAGPASFHQENPEPANGNPSSFRVVAYFRGDISEVEKYDYNKVSHLIYCFMYLQGNQIGFKNEDSENTLKCCLNLKKRYPHLKVLVSFGGWGGCETCSYVFSTEKGRTEFARSVKKLLDT